MFTETLDELIAKTRITECIKLYAHAVDRRQWDLLDHVFHEDATWHMSSYDGAWREALVTVRAIFDRAVAMSFHQISNILVALAGAEATSETYCVGYHRVRANAPPGGIFGGTGQRYDVIAAVRYFDRFECRQGAWKMTSRTGISEWRSYQPVNEGADLASARNRGRHGPADLSTPVVASLLANPQAG